MPRASLRPASKAAQYEFLAAPQINLSLVYRLDKLSGDVIACQFAHNPGRPDVGPGAFGVTSCYRSGDGATKQEPSDYGLIATRHEQEGGVFRVDYRTGGLSICYLYFQREKQGDHEAIADQYVVCTPQWKQATRPRPFGRRGQRIAGCRSSARLTRSDGRRPLELAGTTCYQPALCHARESGHPARLCRNSDSRSRGNDKRRPRFNLKARCLRAASLVRQRSGHDLRARLRRRPGRDRRLAPIRSRLFGGA